ncbi:hypothetical protein ACOME3_009537 [Neoechinorhynchus agilis]
MGASLGRSEGLIGGGVLRENTGLGKTSSDSGLSKEDFDILLNNSLYSKQQIEEWHKIFLADCPNGTLTKQQLAKSMTKCFISHNPDIGPPDDKEVDRYVDRIFYTFDVDESGFIDFVEFLVALSITLRGKPRDKLKLAFDIYDLSNVGRVHKKEMLQIITSLYDLMGKEVIDPHESSETRVDLAFSKLGLGPDDTISKEEFIEGCLDDPIIRELLLSSACY